MRSLAFMASSLRLVASRHLRDSSTESKVLVLVSINQLGLVYDTHGLVSPQKFHTTSPVHQMVEQAKLERAERDMFGREELRLGFTRLLPSARVAVVGICGDRHILGG